MASANRSPGRATGSRFTLLAFPERRVESTVSMRHNKKLQRASGSMQETVRESNTEPAVVHTSVRDFDPSNPAVGDQIVVEGSTAGGNVGGVNVFLDLGARRSRRRHRYSRKLSFAISPSTLDLARLSIARSRTTPKETSTFTRLVPTASSSTTRKADSPKSPVKRSIMSFKLTTMSAETISSSTCR